VLKLKLHSKSQENFQNYTGGRRVFLIYFSLWIIFNGKVTFEILAAGVLISFLLDVFVKKFFKIDFTAAMFVKFIKILPEVLIYVIVLLIEIVKANLAITKLVIAPTIEVEPCLVKFKSKLKTHAARVALANSITLTPGTITVELNENEFLVHALTRDIAEGLQGSLFERLLKRMERKVNA